VAVKDRAFLTSGADPRCRSTTAAEDRPPAALT
jgi:hypothetical protein